MPHLIVTQGVRHDLERCRRFLNERNAQAASRAGQVIARHFQLLATAPNIGRPLDEVPDLRELIIGFEDSGYVALYRYDPAEDAVFVLAFRHQKEAGY